MPASLRLVLVLCAMALVAAGCLVPVAPLTPGGTPPSPGATPLPTLDLSSLLAVDFRRVDSAGETRARLYRDGRVELQQAGRPQITFYLTGDELAQIDAAFEAADFHRQALQMPAADTPPAGAVRYTITRRGLLLESTLNTYAGAVPTWAEPLVGLLEGLLFVPRPDQAQRPSSPESTGRAEAPPPVVLEFRRTGGFAGLNQQALLRLDGSYSVSQMGTVTPGQLSPEALAELIAALEAAHLSERAGDYLPVDPCCDRFEYELVYRNLLGTYRVRTVDGETPPWLQPLLERLVQTFFAAPQASAPLPTPPTVEASPTVETAIPPTSVPTATPTATAVAPGTAAATPLEALLADLAAAGLTVEPTAVAVAKPYLSASGTVVRVNRQPLQVFQYTDEVVLAADVSGLAPDATSINGVPLAWQGTPHFWRRGPLLVLWVGDDPALLAALRRVLGPQLAGG